MNKTLRLTGIAFASLLLSSVSTLAGPKVVCGPGADAGCYRPWDAKTKFFQWDKKPGPYKIALVNGFVGNARLHPEGEDRQGLRGAAGHQGEYQGSSRSSPPVPMLQRNSAP